MSIKLQKIRPNLWFDHQAEDAVELYTSVFPNSETGRISRYSKAGFDIHQMPENSVLTIDFNLDGCSFTALNGGPQYFRFNPAISFFVVFETEEEVRTAWNKLADGGQILMPLEKQDWSPLYGWLNDRFGVSWQLAMGKLEDVGQRISPLLFFTGDNRGQAEKAHEFYTAVFPGATSTGIMKYGPDHGDLNGLVMHSQFVIGDRTFMTMDSAEEDTFPFNESVSFIINCRDQQEVDYYWNKLLENGGVEQQCGWLKDQFGVSWQVVPEIVPELLDDPDRERTEEVMTALLKMKKLEIEKLKVAANQ